MKRNSIEKKNVVKTAGKGQPGGCPFFRSLFYCSASASFIARTFNGSPNKLMNPSASW